MRRLSRAAGEEQAGFVLVVALMGVLVLSTAGAALMAIVVTETMTAANHRGGIEAEYAAELALTQAIADLRLGAHPAALLSGVASGPFWDAVAGSRRLLPDGSEIDLDQIRNLANCGRVAPCSPAEMAGNSTGDRPWGVNNPNWQFFERGPLEAVSPVVRHSPFYVLVLIGDDPAETDGDPTTDATEPAAGAGVVMLRAEAFGVRGAHGTQTAVVRLKSGSGGGVDVLGWRARP
jgi:hypothetical protein